MPSDLLRFRLKYVTRNRQNATGFLGNETTIYLLTWYDTTQNKHTVDMKQVYERHTDLQAEVASLMRYAQIVKMYT